MQRAGCFRCFRSSSSRKDRQRCRKRAILLVRLVSSAIGIRIDGEARRERMVDKKKRNKTVAVKSLQINLFFSLY